MKKLALAALAVLLLCACASPALAEWQDRYLSQDSAVFDRAFAQEALKLSTLIYYRDQQAAYMRKAGFNTVGYWNFHRPAGDTRHICAYYVYQKALPDGRTAVLILIRGTGDDEWALNMDVMPSGNYDLPYAENFTLAAQDILDTQAAYLDSLADPVFLVSGHSRGAACANILGNIIGGRLLTKAPLRTAVLFAPALAAVYMAVYFTGAYAPAVVALTLVWGIIGGINVNINQYWITSAAPEAPDFANGLFLTAANLGTTFGTMLCGEIIASWGMGSMLFGGIIFLALCFAFVCARIYAGRPAGNLQRA